MSDGFCGIDPAALGSLVVRLHWTAADLDGQAGRAHTTLTRHSRSSVADSIETHLSATSRWARTEAEDLRRRAAAIEAAEELQLTGRPLLGAGGGPLISDGLEDWIRGALGIWNGRADSTFPIGRWLFGNLWINRVAQYLRGTKPIINGTLHVPSIANGWLPRQLANTSHFRWASNPAVQTVGKRLSLGFAVVSTVGDAKIVWDHGNPIDAFEREGAGYVADVARLGFSGSTAAFFVAPNPVTGGVVIVTGMVWAGAEVVDHWDEITETWNAGYEQLERGAQVLYDSATETLGAGWDWTSSRWDEVVDWTGEGVESLTAVGEAGVDQITRAVEWSDERLDDAMNWTGDRVEDLVDVSFSLLDSGSDAWDFAKGLFGG